MPCAIMFDKRAVVNAHQEIVHRVEQINLKPSPSHEIGSIACVIVRANIPQARIIRHNIQCYTIRATLQMAPKQNQKKMQTLLKSPNAIFMRKTSSISRVPIAKAIQNIRVPECKRSVSGPDGATAEPFSNAGLARQMQPISIAIHNHIFNVCKPPANAFS
eukprot:jgi/Bigna1/80261/fgenesh1_pg.69_\